MLADARPPPARHLDRDLVGFQARDRLVDLHRVARLLQPARRRRFGDRFASLGTFDFRHDNFACPFGSILSGGRARCVSAACEFGMFLEMSADLRKRPVAVAGACGRPPGIDRALRLHPGLARRFRSAARRRTRRTVVLRLFLRPDHGFEAGHPCQPRHQRIAWGRDRAARGAGSRSSVSPARVAGLGAGRNRPCPNTAPAASSGRRDRARSGRTGRAGRWLSPENSADRRDRRLVPQAATSAS
jgi:hypothetical protein